MSLRTPKSAKGSKGPDHDSTKSCLIAAAKALFSKLGYDGTSVHKISELAKVNISLISYHFGGKENLYRACLGEFGRDRLAAAQRILQPAKTSEELKLRLEMFFEEFMRIASDDPSIIRMIHREMDYGNILTDDIFKNTFLKIFTTLQEFLADAQKQGLVRKDLDLLIAASLVIGTMSHFVRSDEKIKKFFHETIANADFRKRVAQNSAQILLQGFLAPELISKELK